MAFEFLKMHLWKLYRFQKYLEILNYTIRTQNILKIFPDDRQLNELGLIRKL